MESGEPSGALEVAVAVESCGASARSSWTGSIIFLQESLGVVEIK